MTIGNQLEFRCLECDELIVFSVLDRVGFQNPLSCDNCGKQYRFDDQTLLEHLQKFEALCKQIHASKDILGSSFVAIRVGKEEVKIPYKLLLTRLNSIIDLKIGEKDLSIQFRTEPIKDLEALLSSAI